MEIHVASLIGKVQEISIKPPAGKKTSSSKQVEETNFEQGKKNKSPNSQGNKRWHNHMNILNF